MVAVLDLRTSTCRSGGSHFSVLENTCDCGGLLGNDDDSLLSGIFCPANWAIQPFLANEDVWRLSGLDDSFDLDRSRLNCSIDG